MRAEVPGPEKDKLLPKSRSTAQLLYGMYFVLTMVEVILLLLGGMNLFDSLIHAFGTAGTGGFSNYADSVAHFDSAYIEWVITIFMALFGVNFNLYFFLLLGDAKTIIQKRRAADLFWDHCSCHIDDYGKYQPHGGICGDSSAPRGVPGKYNYYNDRVCNDRFQSLAGIFKMYTYDADGDWCLCIFYRRRN